MSGRGWQLAGIGAALSLTAFMGLDGLGDRTVWLDEAHTWQRSSLDVGTLIDESIRKRHIPTYFLFMHQWLALGDSEVMLRLPSVFFGLLSVAAAFVFGSILGGPRVALAAAALLAVSPWQVRYLQEARMYTMYSFTATVALAGALWLVKHPDAARNPPWATGPARRAWAAVTFGMIGSLYLHNTALFFAAALGVGVLAGTRGKGVTRWLMVGAAVLVAYLPWLPTFLGQSSSLGGRAWGVFSWDEVTDMLQGMYLLDRLDTPFAWVMVALVAAGVAELYRTRRPLFVFVTVTWLLGPLLFLTASALFTPMFLPRAMLWTLVPAVALAAVGLSRVKSPALFGTLLLALVGWRVVARVPSHDHGVPNRQIAQQLRDEFARGQTAILVQGLVSLPLRYYFERRSDPIGPVEWKTLGRRDLQRPGRRVAEHVGDAKHVWLVARERRDGDTRRLRRWLEKQGQHAGHTEYRRVTVDHYELHER